MKRAALYSSSRPRPKPASGRAGPELPRGAHPPPGLAPPPQPTTRTRSPLLRPLLDRLPRLLPLAAALSIAAALFLAGLHWRAPAPRVLTQKEIDAAVLHTLATRALPSAAARAYEVIRPSVVRVNGLGHDHEGEEDSVRGTGSGVVILDTGVTGENLEREHLQRVAGEYRRGLVERLVAGGTAPAQVVVVHRRQVVVHE